MILIVGMPGAGKTEQGRLVEERLGLHWLSTGNLFRETQDPEIKKILDTGLLVKDEHVYKLVEDKLKHVGYDKTFLLDGFPRTVDQAEWLVDHANDIGKEIRFILYLDVAEDIAQERLGGRGRSDDTEEALLVRQREAEKIKPTIEYLKTHGIVVEEVSANGTIEEVFAAIKEVLAKYIDLEHSNED